MPEFTFKKQEHLKSKKILTALFKEGASFSVFPIRIVWMPIVPALSDTPTQMALTVPKKKFKRAVHRNLLRRRLREAYRLNKHLLHDNLKDCNHQYGFMLIYIANEPLPFEQIDVAVKKIIKRLSPKLVEADKTLDQ